MRLRYNNQSGTLGAALTSGGTTFTFAVAPAFATISGGNTIAITVEPGTANEEILSLTAYTAAATTGTITRGAEGSAAVAHANGVAWVHAPTAFDFAPAGPYKARMWMSGAVTLGTASTFNVIPFDTVSFDNNSNCTTGASAKYTVPVAGDYLVAANARFNAASGAEIMLAIFKNGVELLRLNDFVATSASGYQFAGAASDMQPFAANDTVDVRYYFQSNTSASMVSGSSFTWFSIRYLGPS